MLRRLILWLGALLGLAVVVIATQYLASESGEVVVLRTLDAEGGVHETRLWVVDHEGSAWLRAGNPHGGWFPRLSARPAVEVVRGGQTQPFQAVSTPEARDMINDLMQQKYGLADSYISFYFPRSQKIPVRLVPASAAP
ncbi:MAG: hypothetical protein E4H11_02970 [Myxococcales bacterium]|jgi:hypothetical protein|nr:MAG: hypothetical protein E4H11_02970 [Myxococcales bacterium]